MTRATAYQKRDTKARQHRRQEAVEIPCLMHRYIKYLQPKTTAPRGEPSPALACRAQSPASR
jgi:hypothetical protein